MGDLFPHKLLDCTIGGPQIVLPALERIGGLVGAAVKALRIMSPAARTISSIAFIESVIRLH